MEDLRRILDPFSQKIRRAVLCPTTGCIIDKTKAPDQPEIDSISEICSRILDVEPRHSKELLHRAIVLNKMEAWNALYDDIRLGYTFDASMYQIMLHHHLMNTRSCQQLYVIGVLFGNRIDGLDIQDISTAIQQYTKDPLYIPTIEIYQKIVQVLCPDTEDVAQILLHHPELSGLFATHPLLVDVYVKHRNLPTVLCDYALSVDVSQRYYPLSIVAIFIHNGLHIQHPVGLDTLCQLRRKKFDIKVCAAACVVSQSSSTTTPEIKHLCTLIETLCATIQRFDF